MSPQASGKTNKLSGDLAHAMPHLQLDAQGTAALSGCGEALEALARLEQGNYGNCFDCGEEIAEKRLRALPFAVRCKDCEEARENAEQRERQ